MMICICERIFVRKVPLSDVETSVAPVKHCSTPTRGCVYMCATACVSAEHAHSMDEHSGIRNGSPFGIDRLGWYHLHPWVIELGWAGGVMVNLKSKVLELPWRSSAQDPALSMWAAQVPSLVGELDPPCRK